MNARFRALRKMFGVFGWHRGGEACFAGWDVDWALTVGFRTVARTAHNPKAVGAQVELKFRSEDSNRLSLSEFIRLGFTSGYPRDDSSLTYEKKARCRLVANY